MNDSTGTVSAHPAGDIVSQYQPPNQLFDEMLGSPLLDLLAYAPHLLVWEEDAALTHCQYRLNCLTTLLMPAGTDRSHTTMAQVRLTLEFIYKLLSICVSRYWSV